MLQLTAVTVLLSYIFSTASYGLFAIKRKYDLSPNFKHMTIAIVGFAFSIWLMIGSGTEAILWGSVGILAGLPIYFWKKKNP